MTGRVARMGSVLFFFNLTEHRNECQIVFGGDCFDQFVSDFDDHSSEFDDYSSKSVII